MDSSAIFLLKLAKLMDRFNDLENEITNREHKMDIIEARIFNDNLNKLYQQLITNEAQLEQHLVNTSLDLLSTKLAELQPYHLKVINLQTKLTRITSSTLQGSSTTYTSNPVPSQYVYNSAIGSSMTNAYYNPPGPPRPSYQTAYNQIIPQPLLLPGPPPITSNQTPRSQLASNPNSRIDRQKFLIKRLESTEIPEDIGSVEAELLYNQLTSLYNLFFTNQLKIEETIDSAQLENQKKIYAEFHQKIIDAQRKLKKIIKPNEKIPRTAPTDTKTDLQTLLKKSESILQRMKLLEPTDEIDAAKADIFYQHLTSLHESFMWNQDEIESQLSGASLDEQLEISRKTQETVIDLQIKLKKISSPTNSLPTSPEFEEFFSKLAVLQSELDDLSDLRAQFYELFETMSDLPYSETSNQHLDISKDIQKKVISLQTSLNQIRCTQDISNLPFPNVNNPIPTNNTSSTGQYSFMPLPIHSGLPPRVTAPSNWSSTATNVSTTSTVSQSSPYATSYTFNPNSNNFTFL